MIVSEWTDLFGAHTGWTLLFIHFYFIAETSWNHQVKSVNPLQTAHLIPDYSDIGGRQTDVKSKQRNKHRCKRERRLLPIDPVGPRHQRWALRSAPAVPHSCRAHRNEHLGTRPPPASQLRHWLPVEIFCKPRGDWLRQHASDFIKQLFSKLCKGNKWENPWDNRSLRSTISRLYLPAVSRSRICRTFWGSLRLWVPEFSCCRSCWADDVCEAPLGFAADDTRQKVQLCPRLNATFS